MRSKKEFEYAHISNLVAYASTSLALIFGAFLVTYNDHGFNDITILAGILSVAIAIISYFLVTSQTNLYKEIIGK